MIAPNDEFHSIYINNNASKNLALFHGTGGDENDLLPLVENLSAHYNFLGIRGNIQQSGMNRYFIRNADGSFDQTSIQTEAEKLLRFLSDHPVDAYVGYSNGSNMILALALLYPDLVHTAVLLHPKLPLMPQKLDLSSQRFLISYGESDQMITMQETKEAIDTLKDLGATVEVVFHTGGHELHRNEIEALTLFLGK